MDEIPKDIIDRLRMSSWWIQKIIDTSEDGSLDIAKPEDMDAVISALVEIKIKWIEADK